MQCRIKFHSPQLSKTVGIFITSILKISDSPKRFWLRAARVESQHLEVIEYCLSKSCEWSLDTTIFAAQHDVETLRFCIERGCPWNSYTTVVAARDGKLDCLKFCAENNCMWHPETSFAALWTGHVDCYEFSVKMGCYMMDPLIMRDMAWQAARRGYLESLQLCLNSGCKMYENLSWIANINRRFDCFVLAVMNGFPVLKPCHFQDWVDSARKAVNVINIYWRRFQARRAIAMSHALGKRGIPVDIRFRILAALHSV